MRRAKPVSALITRGTMVTGGRICRAAFPPTGATHISSRTRRPPVLGRRYRRLRDGVLRDHRHGANGHQESSGVLDGQQAGLHVSACGVGAVLR